MPKYFDIWSGAEKSIDYCDYRGTTLPLLSSIERHRQVLSELRSMNVKQRFITEITADNLSYCKDLAKVVEMRHLAGVKGNFLVIDEKDYYCTVATSKDSQSRIELLHSTVESLVVQQEFVFETLWNKAAPIEQRIKEIEEGIPIETTEVVRGVENIVRKQIEGLISTKVQNDACCDNTFPASLISSKPVWDLCLDLQNRGVKLRTITEITPKNIEYCKQMTTRMELRHMDTIRGNFSITDRKTFLGAAAMEEGKPPTEGIRSTANVFVEQQQYFFETLWNKAIPADQRITEIEEGIVPETIETLSDSSKIQQLANNLVGMASKELLIMFASVNEYRRQQDSPEGFLRALLKVPVAKRNKLNIRIALPTAQDTGEKAVDNIISKGARIRDPADSGYLFSEPENNNTTQDDETPSKFNAFVTLRRFEAPLSTMITIIIIDRKYALVVELKNDSEKKVSKVSSGLAIYSNSKAIVLSYVSIFELLWTHMELYEELKVREMAQKEFIAIAAHELRAPIQPILGLAEEIHARQKDNSEGRLLAIILRSASNLQRLADNLLDVARVQNNTLRLSLTQFDVNELISSVLADYTIDAARNKNVGIQFDAEAKQLLIQADRDRVYQVLSNCLQNALKFTENGFIVVSSKKKGGSALVTIKDNGRGIDPEILPKLFKKFATVSPSNGTGLGLFISKEIVEAHGGKIIGMNNTGERGATFEFTLPLRIADGAQMTLNKSKPIGRS